MKKKIPPSVADIVKIQKGTRRTGQRIVPKGTEPCIVWVSKEDKVLLRETEAHISLEPELRISVSESSELNRLISAGTGNEYVYTVTYVDGRSTPKCEVLTPTSKYSEGNIVHYICRISTASKDSITQKLQQYNNSVAH